MKNINNLTYIKPNMITINNRLDRIVSADFIDGSLVDDPISIIKSQMLQEAHKSPNITSPKFLIINNSGHVIENDFNFNVHSTSFLELYKNKIERCITANCYFFELQFDINLITKQYI